MEMYTFGLQNTTIMYVLMIKDTDIVSIFREKKYLSEEISCSVATIRRKECLNSWEWGNFIIYNPAKVIIKSSRGGKRAKKEL